jgi:transcription elongation factor GreA
MPPITPNWNYPEELLMPIDTQRVWLTEETYDLARVELALLRMELATGSHRGGTDPRQRALRIRQLQELIATAAVGHEPPDDGVAEPGMVLTVQHHADDLTETFLMADRAEADRAESASNDLPIYSPRSPLGRALCGARAGEQRQYLLPGGETMAVTLLNAVPFRQTARQRRRTA